MLKILVAIIQNLVNRGTQAPRICAPMIFRDDFPQYHTARKKVHGVNGARISNRQGNAQFHTLLFQIILLHFGASGHCKEM